MSAMTDTKDRQEGIDADTGKKVGEGVDFVDYFTAGVSLYTKKGDDQGIKTWDDLCGKKIAVQRNTVSHDLAKDQAKKCTDGKKPHDRGLRHQPRGPDPDALRAARTPVSADFPVAAYAVKTSGGGKDFEIVGDQVEAGPYGIAVAKDNTELRDALQAAARRDHQERRVREDHQEVGRRGRRDHRGHDQRRHSLTARSALKGNTRDC